MKVLQRSLVGSAFTGMRGINKHAVDTALSRPKRS